MAGAQLTLTPIEVDTGEPLDDGWRLAVDAEGNFRSTPLDPGLYLLEIRATGYHPLDESVVVRTGLSVSLDIRLAPDALDLEGIVVTTRRNLHLEEGGFYARQSEGLGTFFTREDLAQLNIVQPTEIFRLMAGVTLVYGSPPTAPLLVFRQGCRPDIVIDGTNMGPDVRLDDVTAVDFIEGIEVYRGASVPGTLSRSPCGAVIVWTLSRDPDRGSPLGWKRLIVVGVLVLLGQIIRP